ncbi:MAG: HMA2 domain-containing protein [Treponemataceae bacterium]
MQINCYTGRIRLRDPALRDEDLRNAAIDVVEKVCKVTSVTYNGDTASILLEYEPESIPPTEKLKQLIPLGMKLQSKLKFYSPQKKDEILALIKKAGQHFDIT